LGTVRDATGAPVGGALVAAVPAVGTGPGDAAGLVTSRPDGAYVLERLPPGAYGVTATAEGKEGGFVAHVVVDVTHAAHADLKLGDKGGTLAGSVTDLGGHAIPSAIVAFARRSKEDGDVWYSRTDPSGTFRVSVPQARYTIRAKASGFQGRPEYTEAGAAPSSVHVEMEPDDVSQFAGSSVIDELRAASIRLRTCDPASDGLDDMAGIERFVGEARLVGLGESVHGGHEVFLLKHRLFRFLVEKLGFTVLAIEASWPDTVALNQYVLGGRGDPTQLVPGMRFWIWDTEEMIALVTWMRAYNADSRHRRKLQFVGFDMQSAPTAVAALRAYLGGVDRAWADRITHDLANLGDEYEAGHLDRWPAADRETTKRAVGELLAAFDERKTLWIRRSSVDAWSIARHHVEILSQFLRLGTEWHQYDETRDRAMAEDVSWIVSHQPPGTKIALWAHNTHLARKPWYGATPNLGKLLSDAYGKDYVVFAISFLSGAIRASSMSPPRGLLAFDVPTAPPGTIEGTLARIGPDVVGVDLAGLARGGAAERWSHYRLQTRLIGAAYTERMKASLVALRPADLYDAFFVIPQTTPSRYSGPMQPPVPPLPHTENFDFEQAASSSAPPGWVVSSLATRSGYRAHVDERECFEGERCAVLARPGPILMPAFGSLQQSVDAKAYRGKRMRLRAAVRLAKDVDAGGAQLFLQSEDKDGNVLGAVNLTDHAVRTKRWSTPEVALDVGVTSAVLRFGLVLSGSESAWLDSVSLEPVDAAPAP
jgi:erythromycin esterase